MAAPAGHLERSSRPRAPRGRPRSGARCSSTNPSAPGSCIARCVAGRANTRYALLFRDFLRTHPDEATAYAELKRRLAAIAPDSGTYADAKDPVCDLIYFAAERWASDELESLA